MSILNLEPLETPLDKFCGSLFWDDSLFNTTEPDFTRCFENTVLIWVPCFFLWIFAPLETHYIIKSKDRGIPWSWVNISKIIISLLLMIVTATEFFYVVHREVTDDDEPIYGVEYMAPALLFVTLTLQLIFVLVGKNRGIQSSGILFIFWLLLLFCGVFEYRTHFINMPEEFIYVIYNVYYPLVILGFLLQCFADKRPRVIDFPRGENACPEMDVSFLSRLTFAWMDPMVWRGYRRPLSSDDMWDLSYENASSTVVRKWNNNWNKSLAKTYNKGKSHTRATYTNNSAHVEVSGVAPNKEHYISILPTMVKTYGSAFAFGGCMKLIHDILQFISPLILDALIKFSEDTSNETPVWKGYYYAILMLVCAQLQSFILNQYFLKMFLVGLRVRTGIISAVYRKALKLSSSSKKESTVGEIVNLMSVDAQRFMDLTTYLNMLWSAPLQIIVALVMLYFYLKWAVFMGLLVMILLIPINGVIASKIRKLQISQMKSKDKRVKMMNEILNGIKVLKLYAWEPSFENQVLDIRRQEIKVLKKSAYLNAGTSFIWTCTPFLVNFVMFLAYVFMYPDEQLTPEKIFVSMSLSNILRMPMAMLPFLIVAATQANVSLNRMNKFMNSDELDPSAVQTDNNQNNPITVENGTFSWGHDKDDKPILKNINLKVKDGALIGVVGTVGSGKSSLCSALLGEMEKDTGKVNIKGDIAFVPQQAWIQNATLEDNILFGKELKKDRYQQVVTDCALAPDLDMLPAGDQTEIGEKGINLSGGQKQRVSLARAVYSNADIFILDDPLSAVDSHVGKHLFEKVIGPDGCLKGKTRLLVTHGLTYLPNMDHIIVLKDGQISEEGSYKQLVARKGPFQEFLLQFLTEGSAEEDFEGLEHLKEDLEKSLGKEEYARQLSKQMSQISRTTKESESSDMSSPKKTDTLTRRKRTDSEKPGAPPVVKKEPIAKPGEKLIQAEKSETGKVKLSVYGYYVRAIGIVSSLATVFFYIVSQSCSVGASVWLSKWSEDNDSTDASRRDMYLGVYGALGVGQALAVLTSSVVIAKATINASKLMHARILNNVVKSPMSFFDMTPVGRIINRFAKDIDVIDVLLPMNLRSWTQCLLSVLATFLVIIVASQGKFAIVCLPLIIIYYFVQLLYVSTSRQLKRLESVSRSPIYSHFGESIQGASTIRAYGKELDFIKDSEKKVDFNQRNYYPSVMANRWLAIRLEFTGNLMTFFAALFTVLAKGNIDAGTVGLSVSYALQVTQTLNWLVRMTSDVETNIVAVERVKEYSETPQEAPWNIPQYKPSKIWPDEGVVKFDKYSTRYREGLDLVVKGIDCIINSGEKIGIVGRTGAGKSSLTLALFRIIEKAEGGIVIDGVDISKIGLHDLRSRLTIIPQDPVLFSGNLRMNLDPFNAYSDEQVWDSLEHAHLKDFVSELPAKLQHEISEGGENLSVGQRQLVCLARALLRKTKILVLDEATAAVDLETDDLIQHTIRREFSDCTVLTIAHRLNTIMDSTRVLVLDKGLVKEFDPPDTLLKDKSSIFYGMAKDAGLAS